MTFRHTRDSAAAAALVLLVACGAASAHSARPSPGTIRSGTSLSDGRIARDARLRLSDLPPGWKAVPQVPLTATFGCPGLTGAKAAAAARGLSPAFEEGQAEALSAVYIYATSATAAHWFGQLSGPRTRTCIARSVRRILTGAAPPGVAVSVKAYSAMVVPVGNERAADRIVVGITAPNTSEQAYLDLAFVRVGRGIAVFSLADVGSLFPLETKVLRTVTGRLAADLGGAG